MTASPLQVLQDRRSTHEARFLCLKPLELSVVKPQASLLERLSTRTPTEGYFFELHSALRAPHEMELTLPRVEKRPNLRSAIADTFAAGSELWLGMAIATCFT